MRLSLFVLLLLGGVVAIVTGLLVPAHLRAVDPQVLRQMTPGRTLVDLAEEQAATDPAVAKLLLLAAEELNLAGTERALEALREGVGSARKSTVLAQLEKDRAGPARVPEVPVLAALRPLAARERLANSLQSAEARRVLENRWITNTSLFAPVSSAAGFPFEAAILTTAFLVEQRAFDPAMHGRVLEVSATGGVGEIEEFYINILALAKRFSSAQIAALVGHLPSLGSLDALTRAFQEHAESTALLYSAVLTSENGAGLARYLSDHPQTAVPDIALALARGSRPLNHLLAGGQPVFRSVLYEEFASDARLRGLFGPLLSLATRMPALALLLKFLLLIGGAVLIVGSTRFIRRAHDPHYVWYSKFNYIRQAGAALVLVLLLVLLGEPYLAQGGAEPPERPRLKISLAALTAPPTPQSSSVMLDQHTILTIATFLALQTVIYVICLVKLAEIRKQPVPNGVKLKLLENEDNLFDGGLYCGLFGTAAALILLTLGVIKPSLVSAYSSTLFGILSVAIIKILHVRPLKRRLILETTELQTA
jgi:hypothetical protein